MNTIDVTMNATTEQSTKLRSLLVRNAVSASRWYAVIDAAQDDTVPQRAQDAGLQVQSLYAGDLGAKLDHVAPHLTTFDPDGAFAPWLFENWGGYHGILLQSKASFDEVRKHLRHFLMVKDQAGKKYRFRFYDPRILRCFLPVCSGAEVAQFFGPVQSYYAATRAGTGIVAFRTGPKGLRTTRLEP